MYSEKRSKHSMTAISIKKNHNKKHVKMFFCFQDRPDQDRYSLCLMQVTQSGWCWQGVLSGSMYRDRVYGALEAKACREHKSAAVVTTGLSCWCKLGHTTYKKNKNNPPQHTPKPRSSEKCKSLRHYFVENNILKHVKSWFLKIWWPT